MRKTILLILTLLLLFSSSAFAIDPNSIDREFLNYSSLYWTYEETRDSGYTLITETASPEGHFAQLGIRSRNGSVMQVYFIGWLADMDFTKSEDLIFSEGLRAYNDCLYTLCDFLPDDREFDEIFTSYGIYHDLMEGVSTPYHEAGKNWITTSSGIGKIEAYHTGSYKAVAERTNDGWMQFQVFFP